MVMGFHAMVSSPEDFFLKFSSWDFVYDPSCVLKFLGVVVIGWLRRPCRRWLRLEIVSVPRNASARKNAVGLIGYVN